MLPGKREWYGKVSFGKLQPLHLPQEGIPSSWEPNLTPNFLFPTYSTETTRVQPGLGAPWDQPQLSPHSLEFVAGETGRDYSPGWTRNWRGQVTHSSHSQTGVLRAG